MFEYLYLVKFLIIQSAGIIVAVIVGGFFVFWALYRLNLPKTILSIFLMLLGVYLFLFAPKVLSTRLEYPFSLKTFGPANGPAIPLKNILAFFKNVGRMEKVADIARDPNDIPAPIVRKEPTKVKIEITAKEVVSEMSPGVVMPYWTFDGKIPGPFLRVKEGDTVELTLNNDPSSVNPHSIDLHAVNGPGGGAIVTGVLPGESKTLTFKALNPGLYVYHCAHPDPAVHMAHGMYGLILVEPKEGLPKVDKEFYVMQGEFYTADDMGDQGLQVFDAKKMLEGHPEYVVFNGRTKGAAGNMNAKVGDKIRIYFGNGGVNLVSSFHLIGEIFDKVYPDASISSEPHKNVQTTIVPAGGATVAEVEFEVPGNYILVDHALARMDRGAWGTIKVDGPENKEIFDGVIDTSGNSGH
ncbi:MAG: nitrite reductase, copper-containing [Patescibacteria group bacterium]|nr:nitrite reductase, copper-containing [Patescibacteria group bacterium]MDE2218607.1 nitrite reductase, copper-containing [Patescibacteria group bacterium]